MAAEPVTPDLPQLLAQAQARGAADELGEALDLFAWLAQELPGEPRVHVAWAETLERAGRPDQAKQQYRRAIDQGPVSRDAHLQLGWLEIASGRPDAAADVFERGLAERGRDDGLLLGLGTAHRLQQRPVRARESLAAVRDARLLGRAHVELGECELMLVEPERAAEHFERALAAGVSDDLLLWVALGHARSELMRREFARAERRCDELLLRLPADSGLRRDVRFLRGIALLGRQRSTAALAAFAELRHDEPDFLEARLAEVGVLQRLGRYPEAWSSLARVDETAPGAGTPHLSGGSTLLASSVVLALIEYGDLARATSLLETLGPTEDDECLTIARAALALARRDSGEGTFDDYETAVVETRRLRRLVAERARESSLDPVTTATLAGLLLGTDQLEEAGTQIAAARERVPHDPMLHALQGIVHSREGEHSKAAASFRAAVRLDPSLPVARVQLGHALLRQEQVEAAAREYEAVLAATGERHVEAHAGLGQALTALGDRARSVEDYEAAVDHFTEALRLARSAADADPRRRHGSTRLTGVQVAAIEYARGLALTRIYEASGPLDRLRHHGRLKEARDAFRAADEADPENWTARRATRAVERRMSIQRASPTRGRWALLAIVGLVFVLLQFGYYLDMAAVDDATYRILTPTLLGFAIVILLLPELLTLRFGGFELQKATVEHGAIESLGLVRDDRLFELRALAPYDISAVGGGGVQPSARSSDPSGLRMRELQDAPDNPQEAAERGSKSTRRPQADGA